MVPKCLLMRSLRLDHISTTVSTSQPTLVTIESEMGILFTLKHFVTRQLCRVHVYPQAAASFRCGATGGRRQCVWKDSVSTTVESVRQAQPTKKNWRANLGAFADRYFSMNEAAGKSD